MKTMLVMSFTLALFTFNSCTKRPSESKILSGDGRDTVVGVDQPVRILEENEVEYAYPHWSKEGDRILYQSNVSGFWQLYIMNEDGTGQVQITRDASNNNFPDWSPDNALICFVSDRSGNDEIYTIDADGNGLKRLTFNDARDIHPYWTPDGKKILFSSTRDDSGDFEIYEMDPDGGSVVRVTNSGDNETCARLAPTLDRIVYLKNNDRGLDDVFLMDLRTGSEVNITGTPTRDGWPAWTPDGGEIVFSAVEADRYKLFLYDVAGNSIRRLTDPPADHDDGRAAVSADGKKIVFNRQVSGEKNTIGIYVLHLE